MAPLLILRDIHLTFGGPPLLEGADLAVSVQKVDYQQVLVHRIALT